LTSYVVEPWKGNPGSRNTYLHRLARLAAPVPAQFGMELHGHKLLLELADYGKIESAGASERLGSLAVTTFAVFCLLWAIEYAAYAVYGMIGGELFTKKEWRVKFGRHTMDIVAMVIFSYMGFEALGTAPFHGWDTLHAMRVQSAKGMLEYGHARAYVFSESAQRLCVWQIAYQLKNFCDAVIHNDGPLFLAHHIVTGLLSVSFRLHCIASVPSRLTDTPSPTLPQALALQPFLHIYCAYFLGVSEISTAILCGLVLFDEERGVPPLAKKFPVLMQLVGVSFALAFIIFRIVLWPYACYYFWLDMLAMLASPADPLKGIHSVTIGYIFMGVNAGLTLLQFYWLTEILSQALKFFSEGDLSMKKSPSESKKLQ